jgi:hypothetical protein
MSSYDFIVVKTLNGVPRENADPSRGYLSSLAAPGLAASRSKDIAGVFGNSFLSTQRGAAVPAALLENGRLPELDFIDDKAGKPVGINVHIGRRPVAAFGNSDGDQQLAPANRLALLRWGEVGRRMQPCGLCNRHATTPLARSSAIASSP